MCSQSVASIVWTLARAREAYYIDTRLCTVRRCRSVPSMTTRNLKTQFFNSAHRESILTPGQWAISINDETLKAYLAPTGLVSEPRGDLTCRGVEFREMSYTTMYSVLE
eukprot:COSAG05_NODE_173_length_14969_cov_29.555884_3_plen_109_part_00